MEATIKTNHGDIKVTLFADHGPNAAGIFRVVISGAPHSSPHPGFPP